VLVESRERLGGNVQTEEQDGFLIDAGPDSFLRTKPDAVGLCNELGLADELITPRSEARKVYIVHRGRLVPMPGGLALTVPTRIAPLLGTPLLGAASKLRMLGDLMLPARSTKEDESIASFITRRFGTAAAERLAAPLLGGIYAGDIGELSVHATFPQLVELERRYGSLIVGLFSAQAKSQAAGLPASGRPRRRLSRALDVARWLRRQDGHAPSPFCSLRSGMGRLIDALAEKLPSGAARVGVKVVGLTRIAGAWHARLADGGVLVADAVVLAVPAHVAAGLVPDSVASNELAAITYHSTATVFAAFRREDVAHSLDGMGFVVPPGEGEILAATWVSSKWSGRAPAGHVLIRAFVGGAKGAGSAFVERADDRELVALSLAELCRLMGPLGQPLFSRVFRYLRANPQPLVGHNARLERLRERLTELPGLYLAGAAYEGVGIPDCVRQGREAANRALLDCRRAEA
jgi:oxygen-dependent protoporphyrinogen oxidase